MYRWLAAVGSILRHVIMGRVAHRYGAGIRAVQSAAVLVRFLTPCLIGYPHFAPTIGRKQHLAYPAAVRCMKVC